MRKRTSRVKRAKEAERQRIAAYRKGALAAHGLVYNDVARAARVTYSMVDKWMNARRASTGCAEAFKTLTGQPAYPQAA